MQRLTAFTLSLILVTLIVYILKSGESIIVPFLIAFAIAYLIISLAEGIRKIKINGKQIPRLISFLIAILLIVGAIYSAGTILSANVSSLIEFAPIYQEKFKLFIHWLYQTIDRPVPDLAKTLQGLDATAILTRVVIFLKNIASATGIISIYVLFILMEYHFFDQKVVALFQSESGKESARRILKKIGAQVQSYLRIKTLMSIITALSSYTLMVIVGVDFAEFWAFIIFFFNYIPTIGSIIATILPCLLTLLQFQSWIPFAIVTAGLTTIQFVIGNLIEPKIMGSKFNLSGLVIILSLMISAEIWGIAGMILSVPVLMIISIFLSNFPATRPIAVILSQKGEIEVEEE
jgi:predicted PurR-regulated permease PerM